MSTTETIIAEPVGQRDVHDEQDGLAVTGLTVRFGDADPVVDGVGFTVRPGEILAVVGESGSGKSVSAKALLGLLPAAAEVSGSVRLSGRELLGLTSGQWQRIRGARIAMVFQDPSTALNPVFPIGWQLGEALRAHGRVSRRAIRARAVELLELVGIADPERRVDAYPHQLSGGQRQRVVIAMALANDPEVIVADEPTTALDVTVQAEILALLRRLRDRLGTSIVLITHNLGVVAEIADTVAVMRDGTIVERATARTLLASPEHAYTRELLDAIPRFTAGADESDPSTVDGKENAAVELTDLAVEYTGRGRTFRAVGGVTLAVRRGAVLGLVGESGSGKSTIGRAAAGLVRPAGGSVRVLGADLSTLSGPDVRALRARIGFVFQDSGSALDPFLPVGESIAEPLRVHRDDPRVARERRVAELLDAVRLPERFAHRRPGELSGGQRQRVGLARALALGPELLIADEPTSALDVAVQARVLDLLRELHAELGFACLFISHDLAVVHSLADEVAVVRHGELVEHGPAHQVLGTPRADYTRRLVSAVPSVDRRD